MTAALWVMLGGALGGPARFGLAHWFALHMGQRLPWGTLVVNVSGSLAIGALAAHLIASGMAPAMATGGDSSAAAWHLLAIGFLGAYTTVSSFSLQWLTLLRQRRPGMAFAYLVGSVGLCLLAVALGYFAVEAAWARNPIVQP